MTETFNSRLQRLLNSDEANVKVSPDLMQSLHPLAFTCLDLTAESFRILIDALSSWPVEAAAIRRLEEVATTAGLSDDQLVQALQTGAAGEIPGATAAWARVWALRQVKIVALAIQRYWAYAATDILRLRMASARGYLRLIAEGVALVALFVEDDSVAAEWSAMKTDDDGKRFFRKHQARVTEKLDRLALLSMYELGSASSLHVRLKGLVHALRVDPSGALTLHDQEFDSDDPFSYHLAVAHLHSKLAATLRALEEVLDVGSTEVRSVIQRQHNAAATVWQAMETRYADDIRALGS